MESLIALGLLVTIVSLVLTQVNQERVNYQASLDRQEVLNLAQMAVQTDQSSLTMNGVSVQVSRTAKSIIVYSQGEEILHVEKQ